MFKKLFIVFCLMPSFAWADFEQNAINTGDPYNIIENNNVTSGIFSTNNGMLGLGSLGSNPIIITPKRSGNILLIISGFCGNTGASQTTYQIQYGSGTPPVFGAPQTGSSLSGQIVSQSPSKTPFSIQVLVPGLSIGTTYWFDLYSANGGAGSFFNGMNITLLEL